MAAVSERVSEPMTTDHSQHRQQLTDRLEILRNNERFCDVIVEVKGKEFKAHKAVLAAASPFFLTLLESNMRESSEHLIKIELEDATASIVEDVLKYIYTGNVSVTEESAHNLIATADYLFLPGLKSLACDFLKGILATENCVFNYYFAERYQCVNLKEECRELIKSNFSAVMETDDFLNLDAKQVLEWVSSDDITVSAEEEVFRGIVKWVHQSKSEREKEFSDLLQHIRLGSLDHNFLFNELVKEELITANNDCLNFVLSSLESIFSPTLQRRIKSRSCLQTQLSGIFVCGGRKALCHRPSENIWYQLPNMLMEHQNHAAMQCRDKVYIFSTRNQSGADFYMPSTNTWGAFQIQCASHVEKFCSLFTLHENMTLYALTEESFSRGNILLYDPVKCEWRVTGIRPNKVNWCGSCGVADGYHLYMIGGCDSYYFGGNSGATTVLRIDIHAEKGNCEEVAPMNEGRYNAFGTAMNGKIYVAGGKQRSLVLNTCEMYDPATNEWQMMPSLDVLRYSSSMVCFQGSLYVIGGFNNRSRELSVEMFDTSTNKWIKRSTIPIKNEDEEEKKKNWHYKACFATVHKDVLKNQEKIS
ncbi:kelch-like protein 12 [Porites lutea]|uniref:kelch-like protein 12 n=1 Tax=Porites lutea TaxID=51062 RepID=UPI003CC63044